MHLLYFSGYCSGSLIIMWPKRSWVYSNLRIIRILYWMASVRKTRNCQINIKGWELQTKVRDAYTNMFGTNKSGYDPALLVAFPWWLCDQLFFYFSSYNLLYLIVYWMVRWDALCLIRRFLILYELSSLSLLLLEPCMVLFLVPCKIRFICSLPAWSVLFLLVSGIILLFWPLRCCVSIYTSPCMIRCSRKLNDYLLVATFMILASPTL